MRLQALAELLQDLPGQKVTLLMGVLADKDYRTILDTLLPFAAGFCVCDPGRPRSLSGADLAAIDRTSARCPQRCASVIQAIPAA